MGYIEKIGICIESVKNQTAKVLFGRDENLYKEIFSKTSTFPEDVNLRQRAKLLDSGYGNENHPRCKICNTVHFRFGDNKELSYYCSKKCMFSDTEYTKSRVSGVDQKVRVSKMKETNKKMYGVEFQSQREDFLDVVKQNSVVKYGVDHPSKSDVVKEKIKIANMRKYGSSSYSNSQENIIRMSGMSLEKMEEYFDDELLIGVYKNKCNSNLQLLGEYFGFHGNSMSVMFSKRGLDVEHSLNSSMMENEYFDFISSNGYEVLRNDRKIIPPKEIDIYIPKHKLAIELNGAYWHSEKMVDDKNYHFNKFVSCEAKDIQLLSFWDVECRERGPQIKSYISSKLGLFSEKIYARSTRFVELSEKQYEFFENNHIQGRAKIDRNFALLDGSGRIVACVSYAKHHRDVSKYTLNRLAFLSGVSVVGGASKLVKKSLELIDSDVITWSDNRFSTGDLYVKCGFEFDGDIPPDYCYYEEKTKKILSKQSQQKKKIGCPEHMTENEFCKSLGRYRIWDCGKKRFVHKKIGA